MSPAGGRSGVFLGGGGELGDFKAEGQVWDGSRGNASACGAPASLAHICILVPHGGHSCRVQEGALSPNTLPLAAFAPGPTTAPSPCFFPPGKKLTQFPHVFMFTPGVPCALAGYYLGLGN